MVQLSVKKSFYERYLHSEISNAEAQLEIIRKHKDKWRCQQDQEFEEAILHYRIQQLEKQINKLKK